MTDEGTIFPITFWYSTLGMGDGHDFATRSYLRALMNVGFFGLRIPPSISTSVLMLDEKADPDITQFASLTRPPDSARMAPLKLIKAGDPRIGTTKVIDGTDMGGNALPLEVKIISSGLPPMRPATCSRDFSIPSLASSPQECRDWGLP